MPRWVVLCVLVAAAALPGRAVAADCASLGPASQFDVFTAGTLTANTGGATIQGRMAAGTDAAVQGITLGTSPPLAADPNRADLVVGRNLTVGGGGGSVPFGKVTYGGTLTANGVLNALGGLQQAQPSVDFDAAVTNLNEVSAQWAGLSANGTISGPTYDVRFTGTNPTRNVFALTAAELQGMGKITISVPAGSTTLINVSGSSFTSNLYGIELVGPTPETVLWNFALATSVQQTSGLNWQGTLLAPHAAVTESNGQFYGQTLSDRANIGSELFVHHPFGGCLPPLPTRDLSLVSLCTDPVTLHNAMRLRNLGDRAYRVTWSDRDSAQGDTFTAPAGTDTFFDVLDGDTVHHIVVTSGSTTLETTTTTRACAGTITLAKQVIGEGTRPPGPWRIRIEGDNGFVATRNLADGQQAAVDVPGSYQAGTVAVGEVAGGARYTITEPDPLGGVASVDRPLITILDGQNEVATVTNEYPPSPPEPPVPPQPPLPPGPPDPLPGPDLVTAASQDGGADLAVSETISPKVVTVGAEVRVTVRVRNHGPLPAVAALAREIPQVDPTHPNQIAKIVTVSAGLRAAGCTSKRPVSCGNVTLAPGVEVVVRVRARMLRPGSYKSLVVATSDTPDPNTTNNYDVARVVVRNPANVGVSVHAPARTGVGVPVSYRVVARGKGSAGANSVRFCHRVPAGLLMSSAPGTFRYRGRVCRDVSRLRPGQTASFTVHAIAAARAAGRTLPLLATAAAPGAALALGSDRIAVIAQSFAGTGRG
jgi:choice-of-anchor A domain-containing protein